MATTRREFLCQSLGAFGAAMLAFERFGLLNALAQSADYKALVCIFLNGGNDSGNMVIPYDDYSTYEAARNPSGLAIPQSSLLRTGVVPFSDGNTQASGSVEGSRSIQLRTHRFQPGVQGFVSKKDRLEKADRQRTRKERWY